MALCGAIVASTLNFSLQAAETSSPEPSLSVSTPTLKKIERPANRYHTGEMIEYKIHLHWDQSAEDLRMSPPEATLKNLELVGVAQETESNGSNEKSGMDQLLTFRFTASKAGPASASRIRLRWIQGSGILTNELTIPSLELTIKAPHKWWLFLTIGISLTSLFLIILFLSQKQKKADELRELQKSLEDLLLEQLNASQKSWEMKKNDKDFLGDLTRILHQYLTQKLDWNPSQEDYNALQKKAAEKWSKREAQALMDLFEAIGFERFSGADVHTQPVSTFYLRIYSFIESKKTQTSEEAWKQLSNN